MHPFRGKNKFQVQKVNPKVNKQQKAPYGESDKSIKKRTKRYQEVKTANPHEKKEKIKFVQTLERCPQARESQRKVTRS
jgi:hypothetical protein